MASSRPYSEIIERLRAADLRPTRQRLALAKLLFEEGFRHVTAESLHGEARAAGVNVSLATVYNTLHQFTDAGLLREIVVDPGRSYFDTNTSDHHHFFDEESRQLSDIDGGEIDFNSLPPVPAGMTLERVDVVMRLRKK